MLSRVDQVAKLCSDIHELSRSSNVERVRAELKLILESDQFRTSHRSCTFLQYVVDKALGAHFDELKERILGIELFGRDSSFDTDRDSVVRVAANDVRKRLREYYRERPDSGVKISLPSGVYIPQIAISPENERAAVSEKAPETVVQGKGAPYAVNSSNLPRRYALLFLLAAGGIAAAAALGIHHRQTATPPLTTRALLPWSALLKTGRQINLVVADANLVVNKVRSGRDVPIETYATHNFAYGGNLSGPFGAFLNEIPLTSVSDAILAARIAGLAAQGGTEARVRYCNRFEISELKGDQPLVLFGSPMSNPWVQLLYDKLNFQVVHRFDSGMDVCINRHPRAGELPVYVPTRSHSGFSEGYALIALEPNVSGRAPALIIAGTSTEGTEAAGDFVTDLNRLSDSLRRIGIDRSANIQHLELVIKTSYVSAASTSSELIAYRAE